jgi:tripartite-type tricarboxylate transporter receptor subunit TctC
MNRLTKLLLGAAVLLNASLAAAQLSSKPIKIIVPFAPGGGSDLIARLIAPRLSEALKTPVIVENKAGAGGNIASAELVKSPADGHTLLFGSNTLAISAALYKNLPFDTLRDMTAVCMTTKATMVLVGHPGLPASSLRELIAYAKTSPRNLFFANPGYATPHNLAAEQLNRMAGIKIENAVYKGSGPALADTLAGVTQLTVISLQVAKPYLDTGKLKSFGITDPVRSQLAPEMPTIAESGVPGYSAELWHGLFAPAKTPPEVIAAIGDQVSKIVSSAELREQLAKQGVEAHYANSATVNELFKQDLVKYAAIVSEAGIKVD